MIHIAARLTILLSILLIVACHKPEPISQCGKIRIAEMNWDSASLIAHIDKFILENGFGCDVELVAGDTMPIGSSMLDQGAPDIAPEFWSNAMKAELDRGIADGRIRIAGKAFSDGGEEGFWVPKFLVDEKPELATITGIKAHPELFPHPNLAGSAMLMGCPTGWNCQTSAKNLFIALGLEQAGFKLVNPSSDTEMATAIADSINRKEGWFGYYWSPTAILGEFEMIKVDFGSGIDFEHFRNCITQYDCINPEPTMYPPSPVQTITTTAFANKSPEAFSYIRARSFKSEQLNKLLAWMESRQAGGETAALHFMENYQATWSEWIDEQTSKKILKAL